MESDHKTDHQGHPRRDAGFDKYWQDVELTAHAGGGVVTHDDEYLSHAAWDAAMDRGRNLKFVLGAVLGAALGILIHDAFDQRRR